MITRNSIEACDLIKKTTGVNAQLQERKGRHLDVVIDGRCFSKIKRAQTILRTAGIKLIGTFK